MKKILAIVLSIAILVMAFPFSVFAADQSVATDTWDGTTVEPTTTDADGNIIINTAEEMAWVALVGGAATEGKSYKVADGIESFDMNGSVGITADSTASEVQSATASGNMWSYSADGKSGAFKGNFDGNGVTVFNIRTSKHGYSGLFPFVHNDSTIKNVVLKASYIAAYHYAGGVVGGAEHQKTLNIEKCAVINCYITDAGETNAACSRAAAQFIAGTGNSNVNISNCFASNNILSASGFEAGFVATSGAWIPTGISIKNSISIGMYPYSTAKIGDLGKGLTSQLTVENVYSDVECDVAGFTTLTTAQMQGEAAKANMALTWNIDWLVGEEGAYPSINYGEPIKDPYVWDGTFEEPTETDAEGNIIINTAQEMAWIALRGDTATEGKSYKVADGIECFDMNGAVGITANSTAAEVKDATKTSNIWRYAGDNKVGAFRGNFDGNGVTIYNIYSAGYGYGALFPYVYNESTIKNVIVKASFLSGYHYSAGIVGIGELQKTININKCAVENCYITDNGNTNTACRRSAAQFVAGTGNSNVNISNCFAANNTLSAAGYEAGFVGTSGDYIPTGISITNSISIGMYPYSTAKIGSLGKGLTSQLTVENVYSDVECDVAGFTTLTTDKMQGEAAKSNMNLAWGTNWVTGAEGEYPVIYYGEPIKDPYVWDGTFTEPTEIDADGNIIINTASELAWVALIGDVATTGKNYKVADGVEYFNMNGFVGITADSTVAEVKAAAKTGNNWRYAADGRVGTFYGNFDGNGVTVYNIYTNTGRGYGGLFPVVKPASGSTITIKNVTVAASHIGGYHNAGAIVGLADAPDTSTKLALENCLVKNCYIYDNNDTNPATQRTTGTLVGNLTHNASTISNCLVVDNELSATGIIGGLFGNTSLYGGANTVKNVISIGTSVQSIMVNYAINNKAVTYMNVYTDQIASADGITTLTVDQMQGAAAADNMNLNWDINWAVGAEGEYPSIIIDNAFYDEWDGSFVEPTQTDAEGNIIINSAEEMAWVALRGDTATLNKNYKVADGIKYFNMNGMVGITYNSSADDVFNATKNDANKWNYAADGKVGAFSGNFDGNGVTIYNMYAAKGRGYGGLFPVTLPASGETLTIKNVAVVASYFGGYHCAGAIVGSAEAPDTSTGLLIENVIVNNNFIYDNDDSNTACQRTVGIIGGNLTHNATVINNCFASGNKLSAQGIVGGLFGNTSAFGSPCTVSNTIVLGDKVEPTSINYAINDKVALTTYTNVYTDQATELEGVTTTTVDEMTGNKLTLDWSGWIATSELPEIRAFHNITVVDNGDGTHTESCDDCDIANVSVAHIAGDAVEENRTSSSCDVAGSYDVVVYCTVCGAQISRETIEIPTTEHIAGDAVEENRIDATCDVDGSYESVVYCSVCNAEISRETVTIKALGHNYVKTELPGNEETSATITFDAAKANRTEYSTEIQVWEQNDIKVINNKGAGSNVGDYAAPARFYKNSDVTIEYPGMTKIEIDVAGVPAKNQNAWVNSCTVGTATLSGDVVTIVLDTPVDSYTIVLTDNQARANSITVYGISTSGGDKALVCENCGDVRELPNYGDANGDSTINNKDLALLMQYINGYDVEVDATTVDVNLDGKVNNKDYALIMRYINGWEVELG